MSLLPRLILRIFCVPLPWMLPILALIAIHASSFKPSGGIIIAILPASLFLGFFLGAIVWSCTLSTKDAENGYRPDSVASYIIFQIGGIPAIAFVVSLFF